MDAKKATEFSENIDEVHEHNKVKQAIYRDYLNAFVNILLNSSLGVIIFDGFAGQGIYKQSENDNNISVENIGSEYMGSPLLALDSCLTYLGNKKNDKKYEVKLIFVEEDKINYANLCFNIQQRAETLGTDYFTMMTSENKFTMEKTDTNVKFNLEVHNDKFENQIDNVIRCHKSSLYNRLLSIVDPFGYNILSDTNMSKLVGNNKEIIVTLMARNLNQFNNTTQNSSNIAKVLRVSEEELKNINSELDLAKMFGDNLKKSSENTNSSIKPLYFKMTSFVLVFISNNKKGFFEMKKQFYKYTNDEGKILSNEYEFSQYIKDKDMETQLIDNNVNVAKLLVENFKSKQDIPIKDIKDFVEDETAYIYFKPALKYLERNDIIKVICTDKSFTRKKLTYPDEKNFLISFLDKCLPSISQEVKTDQSTKSRAK